MNNLILGWQNLPDVFSPVLINLGPVPIRWYGLMYIVAFAVAYGLIRYRIKHDPHHHLPSRTRLIELVDSAFTWGIMGVLLGGRFGYVLFYNFSTFLSNPLSIIWPFSETGQFTGLAGMSFHGGLIGVIITSIIFAKINKIKLLRFADFVIPTIPLGYMFGRIGNWLNGELWGRVTESSIGMHFSQAPGNALRHPSQLYEAFGEGLLLFIILWTFRNKKWGPGTFVGIYLAGYGIARFIIEYFREPDAHIGFVFLQLSMGQILSGIMAITGILMILIVNRKKIFK